MQLSLVVLGLVATASARTMLDKCGENADNCGEGKYVCCEGYSCNLDYKCAKDDVCQDEYGGMCKTKEDPSWICCEGLKCVDEKCVECTEDEECLEGYYCDEKDYKCYEKVDPICEHYTLGSCEPVECYGEYIIPDCIKDKDGKYYCEYVCEEPQPDPIPYLNVGETSSGSGETLSLGGGTIADTKVTTGGYSDPYGFFSGAKTRTGGAALGGGQLTKGRATAEGGFSGGFLGFKPALFGASKGDAKAGGSAVGDTTLTDTFTKSEVIGNTGLDYNLPYPFLAQNSLAKSTTLAAGKNIEGDSSSVTKGDSVLLTPDSASLASAGSKNTAGFSGDGVGFAKTKGTSVTEVDPYSSYSKSTGSSSSGVSWYGRK